MLFPTLTKPEMITHVEITTLPNCWIDRINPNAKHSIEKGVLSTSDLYVVHMEVLSKREPRICTPAMTNNELVNQHRRY